MPKNTERLLELAEHLEGLEHWKVHSSELTGVFKAPTIFNLAFWLAKTEDCETAGCIAGHAAGLFLDKMPNSTSDIQVKARDLLGLNFEEGHALFAPDKFFDMRGLARKVGPKRAAKACRRLAKLEGSSEMRFEEIEDVIWR